MGPGKEWIDHMIETERVMGVWRGDNARVTERTGKCKQ